MDIRGAVNWTVTFIATSLLAHADAATPGPNDMPGHFAQVKVEQSTGQPEQGMPGQVAWLTLMQELAHNEQIGDHAASLSLVQHHIALDQEHAELFLQYVLLSYSQMVSTDHTITTRMLCSGDKPKYDGPQAWQVRDVLNDIIDTNLRKNYRRARVNLGDRVARQLDAWLAEIKQQSSIEATRRHRAFLHSDESAEQIMNTACNVIAGY